MTTLSNLDEPYRLVADIGAILQRFCISTPIALNDVAITDKTVSDLAKSEPKLTTALTQAGWPSIPDAEVYHYTHAAAAESILNTGKFRLTTETGYKIEVLKVAAERKLNVPSELTVRQRAQQRAESAP